MTVNDVENYIRDVQRFSTKNTPEHTMEFLRRLGNPQEKFPVIHVAGSNGKGSVCAMLSSALINAGKKTGLFISPHLVTILERIEINGENCPEERFVEAFEEVKAVIDGMVSEGLPHPTFFEILFAMGMVVFAKENVDIAVLETGLGGRLDATNIVKKPLITVITSISLEHTEYLGDTLAKIAGEKAGIIKEGVPVVFDAKNNEVSDVIFAKALEKKAPNYPVYPGDIEVLPRRNGCVTFKFDLNNHNEPVVLPFYGEYQAENGAIAMQAAEILAEEGLLSREDIYEGFKKTKWPGRMQKLRDNVYVDGAHNPDGIRVLVESVKALKCKDVTLFFSMVKEKDYAHSISLLLSGINFSKIIITEIDGYRKLDADDIAECFKEVKDRVIIERDFDKAYDMALESAKDGTLICTGSLYLVGNILALEEKRNIDD
ncbi:MAG: bifunctional folylpolyglutamate synthase/dihydrofolate synthase [Lachnospiraceae bacterium]|nr:bifunctional folylpolyglutamate synthase/dihydrofolate synthase [Lachnospiraceae bacterium]